MCHFLVANYRIVEVMSAEFSCYFDDQYSSNLIVYQAVMNNSVANGLV